MSLDKELQELEELATQQFNSLSEQCELEQELMTKFPLKFAENMKAFEKYLPDIYAQFKNYQPENIKITCTKSGLANIYDDESQSNLYSEDPLKQCRVQVDKQIENPQFTSLSFGKDEAEHNFIHTKYMNKLNNIYLDAENELTPIETMPDHLGSMIMFGIGLGYHLPLLIDDITIEHLYLCEPNCDWFYTSLYTADWKHILETIDERDCSVYFYLGASYKEFTDDFLDNLRDKGSFNSVNAVLYQHYPSESLNKLIKRFSEEFHRCAIGWGFYDDGILSIAHDFANGQHQIPLLKKQAVLPHKAKDFPVFVIANGPSFDSAIKTIKEYQDQAIIFCCGSAIQPLLAHGIIPDFHIANERTRSTYHYLSEFIDNDVLKQINFLTTNIMHPECSELFKWTGMAFKPAEPATIIASEFIDDNKTFGHLMFSNPVVGNTGASFACNLGFSEIYLFGLDFGYKDPSHHHSKDSLYYSKDDKEIESLSEVVRKGEIIIDGNFQDKVYSTTFFNVGKACVEGLLNRFKKVNCYNCSDGAKIKNAIPLPLDNILIPKTNITKKDLIQYIKTEQFVDRNFSPEEYIKWLDMEKFDHICNRLSGFIDQEFTSRADLSSALKQQARYLFSYSHTRHRHIYFLLQGSLTYVQSMFKMMLYSFHDEQAVLEYTEKLTDVFKDFMMEAKDKYKNSLDEVSKHEWIVSDIVKEASK
jgi:hypothetical protein